MPELPTFDDARPTLEVGDLGVALPFLTDVVGLPARIVEGEPPTFAVVGTGTAQIGLVQVDEPAIPSGAACYVQLHGLDALVARLEAASVPLAVPVTERPWGLRDLVVTVPGRGPMIAFGEPTG